MPLDPHVERFVSRLAVFQPTGAPDVDLAARRAGLAALLALGGKPASVARIEAASFAGPAGAVALRVYTPDAAPAGVLPGIIFFHGGGFVAGSLDAYDGICRALTAASRCRLIAVDYRLAPEHPFPAALEDALAATRWIAAHAAQWGVDPARLVVAGDSAGGTLAAVICQRLAAQGDLRPALQLLICPILDYAGETFSRREFARGFLLDGATLVEDCRHYLTAHVDVTDPRVSPLRAHHSALERVARACIHTAEFDPVRDEAADYAARLARAGVATTGHCHSGMIHLFYGLGGVIPYASEAWQRIGADVRAHLELSAAG